LSASPSGIGYLELAQAYGDTGTDESVYAKALGKTNQRASPKLKIIMPRGS